jgi:phosphohistidine swiveling domain-containing protein
VTPEDPLHEVTRVADRWTTNNFAEALPGVPTPLTWDVWRHAITEAAWDVFVRFGAFSRRDVARRRAAGEPVVGIFHGHVAGNIDFMSKGVARLPGMDPGAFEHQLFALDPDATPVRATRRRWPAVAVRAPVAIAGIKRRLLRTRADTDRWWRAVTSGPVPAADARATLLEGRRRFAEMLAAHSFQSQIAQGAFDRVAQVAAAAGLPGLERRLASGYGGLEEMELAAALWAVSRGELGLPAFLAEYGFHGPNEGELASRVWREDSAPVEAAAAAYAKEPDGRSPAAIAVRQDADRRAAEAELLAAVPARRRPGVRSLLRMARAWIPRREIGKAGFLQAVDGARAGARALGLELATRGVLADPADVVYLTLDEAVGEAPSDARDVVAERRARRERYQAVRLPPTWTGMPVPLDAASAPAAGADGDLVQGVPVAPGRVVGTARVVLDAVDCDVPIGADEVLVTRVTDPSWVSMFLTAGALVIDIGGPMSHGAIVARELGIPCVINTGDGTLRIPDGARVEVDGDTGTVSLLGHGTTA